ncbi:MAG TPA: hypothetical protein VN809_14765, partial [Telmatospirillum sp.]|nr:hypothetical protein [Telmatospirillum sp.]
EPLVQIFRNGPRRLIQLMDQAIRIHHVVFLPLGAAMIRSSPAAQSLVFFGDGLDAQKAPLDGEMA